MVHYLSSNMPSFISIASVLVSALQFSLLVTAQSAITPADLRSLPKETPAPGAPQISYSYLVTKAVNDTDNKFSNLVIWGYHNGAALQAAVAADLGPDTNAKAWFNETGSHPQFDFGARMNDTHYLPFGMYLKQQDIYASWGSVQLDPGYGAGLEFNYDANTAGLTVRNPYFGGGWFGESIYS